MQMFHKFFSNTASKVAVAVSGGADSMALCLMLNDALQSTQTQLVALTVDHNLRTESTQEAYQVHQWLSELGIEHHILTWNPPSTPVNQESAREARYTLLTNYCHSHGILTLFTAHHQADQAETFLMRLQRSSGLLGLCGMQEVSEYQGISLCRPLLNTPPLDLKTYLLQKNQPWVDDPSNFSDKYERNRLRRHSKTLNNMGLSDALLTKTVVKLNEANEAIDWATHQWMNTHINFNPDLKYVTASLELQNLPIELARRVMLKAASFVRGKNIPAKYIRHQLISPYQELMSPNFTAFTWAGCYWFLHKDKIFICREWEKCPQSILPASGLYDDRFYLPNLIGKTLFPISKTMWPSVKKLIQKSNLPYEVFLSLPIALSHEANELIFPFEIKD